MLYTTREVAEVLTAMMELAQQHKHEYVTPEHLLFCLTNTEGFAKAFRRCGGDPDQLRNDLDLYFAQSLESVEEGSPELTESMKQLFIGFYQQAESSGKRVVELQHLVHCFLDLEESFGVYFITRQGVDLTELLCEICDYGTGQQPQLSEPEVQDSEPEHRQQELWRSYAECLNETADDGNPLIGREKELEQTIRILCRKDKNNPLHIGEPGVGKTAITYGLARKLNQGDIPEPLKGARIFSVDLGSMLSGTQFRGDFEKRFKEVMESIGQEEKPIVYFDEIHNIVGAGAVNGGSFDVSNMLKPYLTAGTIRFIGATTYEEYKKHFAKSKSLVRRFQNVDIKEPSQEETVKILEGLKPHYEKFHGIKYSRGVLEYAVSMSSKYLNERYLPDKAIDLIDEAGAFRQLHPLTQKTQTVGKPLIDQLLCEMCGIPKETATNDDIKQLATLDKRLFSKVFGQDEAINQVVNAIRFSRAGLLEDNKPLSSLLFVGPTGVGKTEVAKSLAAELGIKLLRFDMSEYSEKHSVAKLIGSPAGYVGYEEGGLLTESVRKNPHAVLLLDEIEKAHSDIYNILLQVMDYATLTDNQGRKADFRNIILIMTSNAGASRVNKPQIGFGSHTVPPDVIMDEVKRVFQPEFRNRLNRIVVFRFMDKPMAQNIVARKLNELAGRLALKQIIFTFTKAARDYILAKGISNEYGAREIDRVINNEVKPLLVDRILFGKLKKGGNCRLDVKDGVLLIKEEI